MPEKRMAVVTICFAAGILTADRIGWSGCLLIALSGLALTFVFVPVRFRSLVVLFALLLLGGVSRYTADRSIARDDISLSTRHVSSLEGRIISDITSGSSSERLTFRVSRARFPDAWRKASGDVMLSVYSDGQEKMPHLAFGDRLRVVARPYRPLEPTNPGQFSWKTYLSRHGIYTCASVRDASQIKVLRKGRGGLQALAITAKQGLVGSIYKVHPREEASVMAGIVLGSYSYLDEQTLSDFTRTGTLHVLAASGYNCFVLVMLAMPLLMILRIPIGLRSLLSMGLVVFYVLMVGPMPSVVRAAIMTILLMLAAPLRRVPDYANLFYVAALFLLLMNPSNLFDVGFQLSFLAVGALVYVLPLVSAIFRHYASHTDRTRVKWKTRSAKIHSLVYKVHAWIISTLASAAVATTAVGLVTAPVVAYYFNYVSLTSLPANLVVAVVTPAIFLDSFL